MKQLRSLAALAAALALAPCAQAHPGHGLGQHGWLHTVTSPDHLIVLALVGAALWFAARLVQKKFPRHLFQGTGVAALVIAAVLWGIRP